jgi:hypothetical protein
MRSFLIRLGASVLFLGVIIIWYVIPDSFFVQYSEASDQYEREIKKEIKTVKKEEKEVKEVENVIKEKVKMRQSVPFVVQAPHAQWDDPQYQDACEEASIIMAHAWVDGENHVSRNDAEGRLEELFDREEDFFGDVVDTSIGDTAKFFREYYGQNVSIKENVSMEDLYNILAQGDIIIAPTNGKWLENPHFSNGGPQRHMLVIVGFDRKNGEFITNDPGTRVGRGYKYKDSILYNAIRDYQTGNKKDIEGTAKTVMVVKK